MAKRTKTPSFVAEFPIGTTRAQETVLEKRFRAGASLYNGTLGESLRRARAMRSDPDWAAARKMPKSTPQEQKARSEAFGAVATRHGFSQYGVQKYSESMRDRSWLRHHLGSHDTQAISKRAFTAVADWVYKGRGRPRFRPGAQFSSIEGKSNEAVIRLRDGAILWDGLALPLVRNPRDPGNWERDSLACRTKYVRIVRRKLRGRMRYYAQLVQEGSPPRRDLTLAKGGVGGLDIGPSTVAVFAPDKAAALLPLAPSVKTPAAQIRRLQRKMDRSRRASNPDNYNADGTVRRGVRLKWVRTRRYIAIQEQKAEIERRLAEGRARDHGALVNRLLSLCAVWKAEKLSYRSFQKNFGRSVARRAPSMLLSTLSRKAASAGGKVVEFPTRSTRLSQFDHSTGQYVKKPLSQRLHVFGDPRIAPVQRDLYSAFLAAHVEDSLLSIASVHDAWSGAEPLLRQSMAELNPIRKNAAASRASVTDQRSVRADRLPKATHGKTGSPIEGVLLSVSVVDGPVPNTEPRRKNRTLCKTDASGETPLRTASAIVADPGPAKLRTPMRGDVSEATLSLVVDPRPDGIPRL